MSAIATRIVYTTGTSPLVALLRERIAILAREARLTKRQEQVLVCLARGYSIAETAAEVGITVRCVKFHRGQMSRRLGCTTRIGVLRRVFQ